MDRKVQLLKYLILFLILFFVNVNEVRSKVKPPQDFNSAKTLEGKYVICRKTFEKVKIQKVKWIFQRGYKYLIFEIKYESGKKETLEYESLSKFYSEFKLESETKTLVSENKSEQPEKKLVQPAQIVENSVEKSKIFQIPSNHPNIEEAKKLESTLVYSHTDFPSFTSFEISKGDVFIVKNVRASHVPPEYTEPCLIFTLQKYGEDSSVKLRYLSLQQFKSDWEIISESAKTLKDKYLNKKIIKKCITDADWNDKYIAYRITYIDMTTYPFNFHLLSLAENESYNSFRYENSQSFEEEWLICDSKMLYNKIIEYLKTKSLISDEDLECAIKIFSDIKPNEEFYSQAQGKIKEWKQILRKRAELKKLKQQEEEKREIARIKKFNLTPYNCPLQIYDYIIKENIIGIPEVTLYYRNRGSKRIIAFNINIYCYNIYDEPVNYPLGSNIFRGITQDEDLEPGETGSSTWSLTFFDLTKKVKIKVTKILFSDGTRWVISK
jgi:hypothetical protein